MTKLSIAAVVGLSLAGCASAPPMHQTTPAPSLQHEANSTLGAMRARDPAIDPVLRGAYAYAVFPDVGRPGLLFENGVPVGYVRLQQHVGETFSELLVLRDRLDIDQLKAGTFDLAHGNATVFVMPHGGNAVQLSSRDQRIDYEPYSG